MIDPSIRIRRAIHLNDLTLLKRIIKNNPSHVQNINFADNGNTSLHLAAQLGHLEIAVSNPSPFPKPSTSNYRNKTPPPSTQHHLHLSPNLYPFPFTSTPFKLYKTNLRAKNPMATDLPHRRRPRGRRHQPQCQPRHPAPSSRRDFRAYRHTPSNPLLALYTVEEQARR